MEAEAWCRIVPKDLLLKHRLVPMDLDRTTIKIGVERVPGRALVRDLNFLTGRRVVPILMASSDVDNFLEQLAQPGEIGAGVEETESGAEPESGLDHVLGTGRSPVEQVQRVVDEAVRHGASDVHFEPEEMALRVRFRMDGVLRTVAELPRVQHAAVLSRLKIMAAMDIAERRRPQDGRLRYRAQGEDVDIRASTIPTRCGEKMVLRILDRRRMALGLERLGLDPDGRQLFETVIRRPNGMVLVTGPTGSGKTTTLYAALRLLNNDTLNICTIEDPVEYELPGVNQIPVQPGIGLTFSKALRSILRQDPDVVMVGEMRDAETAEIAFRAALTGHLVLSTLHTNDAAASIGRLRELGIAPFLIAASLQLVVSQRLVRRVCSVCGGIRKAKGGRVALQGWRNAATAYGATCTACRDSGYSGRIGLFEMLQVSPALAAQIAAGDSVMQVRDSAQREGMLRLQEMGQRLIGSGLTTREEVRRRIGT